MGKNRAGRKRKKGLLNRAKELRKTHTKQAQYGAKEKQIQLERKRRKDQEKRRRAVIPFNAKQSILLVGEGDFSFSVALLRHLKETLFVLTMTHSYVSHVYHHFIKDSSSGQTKDLPIDGEEGDSLASSRHKRISFVATCLDGESALAAKYPTARGHIRRIEELGGTKLDAKTLLIGPVKKGFDRIIFNFPHTGCGIQDTEKNNEVHRQLLFHFLKSSAKCIEKSKGEIHVTLKKGPPYDHWNLPVQVRRTEILRLKSSYEFYPHLYKGYRHRRTLGAQFAEEEEGGPSANADIVSSGSRTYVITLKPPLHNNAKN